MKLQFSHNSVLLSRSFSTYSKIGAGSEMSKILNFILSWFLRQASENESNEMRAFQMDFVGVVDDCIGGLVCWKHAIVWELREKRWKSWHFSELILSIVYGICIMINERVLVFTQGVKNVSTQLYSLHNAHLLRLLFRIDSRYCDGSS